jgi:hypothetical protein
MTANPIDLVFVDGAPVAKSDVRGYEKLRVRMRLADPIEVRNTSLSGQFGGLYVRSLQNSFDLDTSDTTTDDDGVNCIIDADGNRFKKVTIDTSRAQRIVTAAGAITALTTDDIIVVEKAVGAPTTVNVDWSLRKRALTIVDGKGDAATNNITIVPAAGQTQYAIANNQVVIDGNGAQVTLTPLADGTGAF